MGAAENDPLFDRWTPAPDDTDEVGCCVQCAGFGLVSATALCVVCGGTGRVTGSGS